MKILLIFFFFFFPNCLRICAVLLITASLLFILQTNTNKRRPLKTSMCNKRSGKKRVANKTDTKTLCNKSCKKCPMDTD